MTGKIKDQDEILAALRLRSASLVAAGEGQGSIELDDEGLDEEMPLDELEDGEEEVTEIPVHGIATIEGRPTGDGRGFRKGALSIGALPQPLGYEFEHGHGSDNSRVAVVGRIDEFFRKEGEEYDEIRWRGVILTTKDYAAQAIDSIVDGSYTGLSVIVDDIEVDVSEEREELRKMFEQEKARSDEPLAEGEGPVEPAEKEVEDFLDLMVGDGKQKVTWFTGARVRRFDMVPTGAFQEGYIGLGHEFADELEPDQIEAALQALEDCGCLDDLKVVDLSSLTEEQLAEYDALSIEEQEAYAQEHSLFITAAAEKATHIIDDHGQPVNFATGGIVAGGAVERVVGDHSGTEYIVPLSSFAPGTKDGPGWITHPVPTARIRRYWTRGKGAAKIRWGTPGDFNRCRRQLRKYIANPEWLAGTCANMHKEAIGTWPGRHGLDSLVASADAKPAPLFSLVAAVEPVDAGFFRNPNLTEPVGIVIDGDHIYGYVATWNVCHIGEPEGPGTCTLAPRSSTSYAHFLTGTVMTTEGPVATGTITMNTGHAGGNKLAQAAVAHYDDTGTAAADVVVGEDSIGIWYSGRVRPRVSDDDRFALAASGRLSGDWRRIGGNYEMVAALVVNVPGFPIPQVSLAASGAGIMSLVAAGVIPDGLTPTAEIEVAEFDIEGMALAAAEKALELRDRRELAERVAPAREAAKAHSLAQARTKLSTIEGA